MEYKSESNTLHFNPDEQWISGLRPAVSLDLIIDTFGQAYRAYECCGKERDKEEQAVFDLELNGSVVRLDALSERLSNLKELVYRLGVIAAPIMVEEFLDSAR